MSKLALLQETYTTLRSQTSGWSRASDVLMTQSLLLVATNSTDRCDELLEYWKRCKGSAAFFSGLQGELFNTVGILGMIHGMEPEEILRRAKENRVSLRTSGLTGFFTAGSLYTKGTALYMGLFIDDSTEVLEKMTSIMAGWKQDHPWVTGNNDLFYGLLHAMQNSEPNIQVKLTEECFQALKRGGYRGWGIGLWADELQAAAQVVSLWPDVDVSTLEERYARITDLLAAEFSFFAPNFRPVAALLAASGLSIEATAAELMGYYKRLDVGTRETRLLLAINLALLEHFDDDDNLNARLISIVVGLVFAQEMVAVAAAAAASS